MSWVPSLKKKNDIVVLLRRKGIYDDVSEKEVIFLGFFDLIHVCYMSYNIHAQFQYYTLKWQLQKCPNDTSY